MWNYTNRHPYWFIIPMLFFLGVWLILYYHTSIPLWLGYKQGMDIQAKIGLLGNIIVGWGALFGIGIAAWRNRELNRQATAAEKQQASEQLIEAIKLLTQSDKEESSFIEARIGALYSLEALVNTHPKDYGAQVIKTIAAYIYENAQKTARDKPGEPEERTEPSPLGKDVQTAFAVLKSLYEAHAEKLIGKDKLKRFDYESPTRLDDIDFSKADFRWLDLGGVEWIEHPTLEQAQLQGANLKGAELQGANLRAADLREADLSEIKAQGIFLEEADLRGANLQLAELEGAILQVAFLQGADLQDAQLDCSDWRDVDIEISEKELTKEELKQFLQKERLSKKTIKNILEVGVRGLWKPQSAQIFCNKDFPPYKLAQKYEYKGTERLDPNAQDDWKETWREALQNVPKNIYRTVIERLIKIHSDEQNDSPCVEGLHQLLEDKKTP